MSSPQVAVTHNTTKSGLSRSGVHRVGGTLLTARRRVLGVARPTEVGLQRRQGVLFTANVLVASKGVWATMREQQPYLPERPTPNTLYGDGVAQRRIGQLLPDAADTWWRVYDGVDLEAVAQDVVTSIETYASPLTVDASASGPRRMQRIGADVVPRSSRVRSASGRPHVDGG